MINTRSVILLILYWIPSRWIRFLITLTMSKWYCGIISVITRSLIQLTSSQISQLAIILLLLIAHHHPWLFSTGYMVCEFSSELSKEYNNEEMQKLPSRRLLLSWMPEGRLAIAQLTLAGSMQVIFGSYFCGLDWGHDSVTSNYLQALPANFISYCVLGYI